MIPNYKGESLFDKHCDAIMTMFSKKWNPNQQTKAAYEAQFSVENWKSLPTEKRRALPFQLYSVY